MNRRAAAIVLGVLLLAGCRAQPGTRPVQRDVTPTYSEVAAAYNPRIAPLDRLWARTVVRLAFIDANGAPQKEQVEGHCQFIPPSKVLVSFHKAGQPLAMLGSNPDRFWWIELGKPRRAFVGTHAGASPERIAAAGLRVHPLDLMELLGLTPLPENVAGSTVEWSRDGRSLIVTFPGKSARRRYVLDPETSRPSRIELIDANDQVAAFAELSKYQVVAMKGAGPGAARPWVPTFVRVEVDSGATIVIMDLSEPQNDPARFRSIAFDVDRLLEANEVEDVQNLDAGAPPK